MTLLMTLLLLQGAEEKRPHIEVRGIYGGVPTELMKDGKTLADSGVNAVWMYSGDLTEEAVRTVHGQGARIFAEFNTMHVAGFLKQHPDAAPVGPDGKVSPPPSGWQGICPTHPAYRKHRMDDFRSLLEKFEIDGVWLDYHHAHASWEQAKPQMPDTCFCKGCLERFARETKIEAPPADPLGKYAAAWAQWRCDVFTDWVREFREILNAARPKALLGTFHCPWSETDHDGAIRKKLAIDLKAQAKYVDVFSIMPYHARFGHSDDPAWISRQTQALGKHLGLEGKPGEKPRIWPILQLSDWGEKVTADQVRTILDHGSRAPATGVMFFHWSQLRQQPDKVAEAAKFYGAIRP
jgi:uncharacterized lipoprotein YddW (UPF0748 family)